MTIPWMMNCPHIEDGWCVICVSRLGNSVKKYLDNDSETKFSASAVYEAKQEMAAALIPSSTINRTLR